MKYLSPQLEAKIHQAYQNAYQRARARGFGKMVEYRLHWCILISLTWFLQLLPVDIASKTGAWLGRRLFVRFMAFHKIVPTIRVPFPNISDQQAKQLLSDMSANLGRVIAEFVHLKDFSGAPDHSRLRLIGLNNLEAALAQGAGMMVLSGHFANWELMQVALRNAGIEGAKVLQNPSNPFVLAWLARLRFRFGLADQIAQGTGVVNQVMETLRDGRTVQILADHWVKNGLQVEFFGRPTGTHFLPARAALELNTPIVLASVRRTKNANFTVTFLPSLKVPRTGNTHADKIAIMREVNAFYEREIKATPAFWLWPHNRWPENAAKTN